MKHKGKSAVLFAYLKLRSSIRLFTGPWFRYEQHSFMQLFLLCYIKKNYLNLKYKLIISHCVFKICIHASWYFRNFPKIIITVLSCIVILYTLRQTFPVYMMTRIWCWCAEWFYRFRFDGGSWDVHSYIYLGHFSFHSHALLIDVSPNRHWILGHVILLYRYPLLTSRIWRTPRPLTDTCAYYQESS